MTMIGAALLAAPGTASAQTPAPDAQTFVGGLVGVTFGTETGAAFAGRVGFKIGRNLHLFGEIGRITDVTPKEVSDLLDEALEEIGDEVPVSFKAKFPATYFAGGVRWSKANGKTGPFAEGGVGVGHITSDVELRIAGIDFTDEVEELIGDDTSMTEFLLMFGGGVNLNLSPNASVDVGYRFTRIFTEDPAVNSSSVYAMVVWKIK